MYRGAVELGRRAARALEAGLWDGVPARVVAAAWGAVAARALVRPADLPRRTAAVCVGGATLGGSGKTRLAVACARELAGGGARVVLVGHAHRARPGRGRVVALDDALGEVGDEALVCARALEGTGVSVVVGPTRQAAIDRAARMAPDVLVLDGPLRIRGSGTAGRVVSLLSVDADAPWGSGRAPPAGDLRAPREALLAVADHVVPVEATPSRVRWVREDGRGEASPLRSLAGGAGHRLFTAIARPERLVRALRGAGVRIDEVVSVQDHGPIGAARLTSRAGERAPWLATEKCALHLARVPLDAPLGILEADFALDPEVSSALSRLSSSAREA